LVCPIKASSSSEPRKGPARRARLFWNIRFYLLSFSPVSTYRIILKDALDLAASIAGLQEERTLKKVERLHDRQVCDMIHQSSSALIAITATYRSAQDIGIENETGTCYQNATFDISIVDSYNREKPRLLLLLNVPNVNEKRPNAERKTRHWPDLRIKGMVRRLKDVFHLHDSIPIHPSCKYVPTVQRTARPT
jgi:hypothetical protein